MSGSTSKDPPVQQEPNVKPNADVVAPPGSAWQRFYGRVLRYRRQRAARTAKRLPRPVLSVGNLHWGGGGKTPITAAIARHLRDSGHQVVILSRGHGRKSTGPLIVSRGQGAEVPVDISGDEPALLARLKGVAVVVGERRFAAGTLALSTLPCDIFLLDDGFSHVRLARDLELLLFPAAAPLGGGLLLPSGRLREPLHAVQHANAVLLTGLSVGETAAGETAAGETSHPREAVAPAGQASENQVNTNTLDGSGTTWDQRSQLGQLHALDTLRSALAPYGWSGPTFASTSQVELAAHRPIHQALLVSAVARSNSVLTGARELADRHGFCLVDPLAFPDHHSYPDASLHRILAAAKNVDTVLVTGKDLVKLEERLQLPAGCQLVEVEHQAQPQARFFAWIDRRLSDLRLPDL